MKKSELISWITIMIFFLLILRTFTYLIFSRNIYGVTPANKEDLMKEGLFVADFEPSKDSLVSYNGEVIYIKYAYVHHYYYYERGFFFNKIKRYSSSPNLKIYVLCDDYFTEKEIDLTDTSHSDFLNNGWSIDKEDKCYFSETLYGDIDKSDFSIRLYLKEKIDGKIMIVDAVDFAMK